MNDKLAYYEIKGQIAIVTIDHPSMNALDAATKEAIGVLRWWWRSHVAGRAHRQEA
jgi:enoyl-CoA hydratase/carnithine racemase